MKYKPEIVSAYYMSQGLPKPEFELLYIPDRKFRLDIGWSGQRIGVEVQGGIWMKGRGAHSSGKAIKRDMEKHNLGLMEGWRILEVEPDEVCLLETVNIIKKVMFGYRIDYKTKALL